MLSDYVKVHAQEMNENVMRRHIDLYVNDFSIALGNDGRSAIEKFLEVFKQIQAEPVAGKPFT